ncbi:fibrillin-1 [Lingula anatina]|uniref:Fibrillin-1 n=1 Tax=Lingula anatina TaxID=7574 RepID=A0A2R2MMA6_LINAN|nr:fibrillin-1 [Lingula anatina]|eukprot:XP_023931187.1 fibrillin-1 [Lingula anatina]
MQRNILIAACDGIHWGTNCANTCSCGSRANTCDRVVGCTDCVAGWEGANCENDVDECAQNTTICGANAICNNTRGSYTCACETGYRADPTGSCLDINECVEGGTNCEETCTNTPGGFSCGCNPGKTLVNDTHCQDVDECALKTDRCDHDCANTVGSYTCSCFNSDYQLALDGFTCNQVNNATLTVCVNAGLTCNQGLCNASIPVCYCLSGYFLGSSGACEDINECTTGADNCNRTTSDCNNLGGSYNCTCRTGFVLDQSDQRTCRDIDECSTSNQCHANAQCTNTVGSYTCACDAGYTGDGRTCSNINECTASPCHADATCTDTEGSYVCKCKPGFEGTGLACTDINECTSSHDCSPNADCTNTPGSYTCSCRNAFTGDGIVCRPLQGVKVLMNFDNEYSASRYQPGSTDYSLLVRTLNEFYANFTDFNRVEITEIRNDNGLAVYYTVLVNTTSPDNETISAISVYILANLQRVNNVLIDTTSRASYRVRQTPALIQGAVSDIDECIFNRGGCHTAAACINTIGSFSCTCNSGYFGNGFTCDTEVNYGDIDECSTSNQCHANAQCTNTVGSYKCACDAGYTGDGRTCSNINECTASPCHADATCTDTEGSYVCKCKPGFEGTGLACTDINECTSSHDCSPNADCTNTPGSYTCSCRNAFTGDGIVCRPLQGVKVLMNFDNEYSASRYQPGSTDYSLLVRTLNEFYANFTDFNRVEITEIRNDNGLAVYYTVLVNTTSPDNETISAISVYILANLQRVNNVLIDTTSRASYRVRRTPALIQGAVSDIDECIFNRGGCHTAAACINTIGSFSCTCNTGYFGNGFTCDTEVNYGVNITLDVVNPAPYLIVGSAEYTVLRKALVSLHDGFAGFVSLVIMNLRDGSLIVQYTVKVNTTGGDVNATTQAFREHMLQQLIPNNYVIVYENSRFRVIEAPVVDGVPLQQCTVLGCQNGGACDGSAYGYCSCVTGYSGSQCQTKSGLTNDEIAIVAASTVGGILLIVAICILVIVIIYKKRKAKKEKLRATRYDNFLHGAYGPTSGVFHPKYFPNWQYMGRGRDPGSGSSRTSSSG